MYTLHHLITLKTNSALPCPDTLFALFCMSHLNQQFKNTLQRHVNLLQQQPQHILLLLLLL